MDSPLTAWLFPAAVVLFLAAAGFTAQAFMAPTEETVAVTDLAVDLEAEFAQTVTPIPSTLYPEPIPLKNEPFFYMRLLDHLLFNADITLRANPAANLQGTSEIHVRIVAPERWERSFVLREERPFQSSGPVEEFTILQEELLIPLEQYQSFISLVEEETRVMPRADYEIIVMPVINLEAESGSFTINERFEYEYKFTLAGQTLLADSRYTQTRSAAETHLETRPGTVSIGTLTMSTVTARILAGTISVILLIAVSLLFVSRRRAAGLVPEAEQILRKYRARLVVARPDSWPIGEIAVELASFKDLLRIADQLEQSVLFIQDDMYYRFFVIDGTAVYSYVTPMAGS